MTKVMIRSLCLLGFLSSGYYVAKLAVVMWIFDVYVYMPALFSFVSLREGSSAPESFYFSQMMLHSVLIALVF